MLPESNKSSVGIWALAQLGVVNHATSQDSPWTVMWESNVYTSLEQAQQAQTFQALKHGIKYHIFHLEFPV